MKVEKGVYFRREDYASFLVRLLVNVVDAMVFGALCITIAAVLASIFREGRSTFNLFFLAWMTAAFFYFVILKRSRFRTPGYRLGRVRIVGLDGRVPSHWSLFLRLLFGGLGPLNWVLDLIWLTSDTNRQALRDKFANT